VRTADDIPAAAAAAESVSDAARVREAPGLTKAEAADPGVRAARAQQVADTVETARRANPAPEAVTVADQLAQRPPLPWARWVTDHLPDSVNKVLALAAPTIRKHRLKAVVADLERNVRMAQKVAQSSQAVIQSRAAAEAILRNNPKLDRHAVSRMVGEEIGARLDGTDWFESAIRDGASPEAADALRAQARRGFQGIPEDVKAALGPEGVQALDAAIDAAVET
jgi:hypothetical protein